MSPPAPTAARYSQSEAQKATGATYTPEGLARFVAQQMLAATDAAALPATGPLRVLDPAVGDGALLLALLQQLPPEWRARVQVFGFDTDAAAVALAQARLSQAFPATPVTLRTQDFLSFVLARESGQPTDAADAPLLADFDWVIANPPYVRTQIMGAQTSQALAKAFGLTGRIDLYFPFFMAIAAVLSPSGVAGVISSNRYMSTKAGQLIRAELLARFNIQQVWDLGDSKLFDAAVLPSVLIARAASGAAMPTNRIGMASLYSCDEPPETQAADPLAAALLRQNTTVQLPDGRVFKTSHGTLDNGGEPSGVWRVATQAVDAWLATAQAHTWGPFARIGRVRVGVKSTADRVFIRSDWATLPGGEPELLRPLITRHHARRFKAQAPTNAALQKRVLYPHVANAQGRGVVDLADHPLAQAYLESHRAQLSSRQYLIDAGRRWYEFWVPQDPAAWEVPKLVFADISAQPVFWWDAGEGVVNGECYWLRCENGADPDWLWLALAVANSSFIEAFYDHRFNNKLYAGRRRFMAQYVEEFPLPDPARAESQALIAQAKAIHSALAADAPPAQVEAAMQTLDAQVWRVFGF